MTASLARALGVALCVLALVPATRAGDAPGDPSSDVRRLLTQLDRAEPAEARTVAAELVRLGEPAALSAIEGGERPFEALDLRVRRARSWVLLQVGGSTCIDAAAELLVDQDAEVRTNVLAFLSKPELRGDEVEARARVIARTAQQDGDWRVRQAALLALARIDHEAATAALDDLVETLVASERRLAAAALASQPRARALVVDLVQRAFSGDRLARPVPGDVLEALLSVYGGRLAELPQGGSAARDRVPFVLGVRHPSPNVRRRAAGAVDDYLARMRVLGDLERADRFLADLVGEGLDDVDLRMRRASLALEEGRDPEVALSVARDLRRSTDAITGDLDARRAHAEARLLEGAALFALGKGEDAEGPLDAAADVLGGLVSERLELRGSPQLVRAQGELFELLGVVELYRMALLLQRLDVADPRILARARAAHERSLEAHLTTLRDPAPSDGLAQLVGNPLGPLSLVLTNPRNPHLPRAESLDLELRLCEALATVAPTELPGFRRAEVTATQSPVALSDPRRHALLQQIQNETYRIRREQYEAMSDPLESRRLRRALESAMAQDEKDGTAAYLRLRQPSSVALVVTAHLREHGRFAAARELSERLAQHLTEMEAQRLVAQLTYMDSWAIELLKARADLAVGNAWMDQDEPDKAEELLLAGLERLEVLEASMLELGFPPTTVTIARADALVSLAVNANVKQQDEQAAVDYFERAYELREDDFTRVLLACYRARAGLDMEARDALSETPVIPANYYNLACTYALLGDAELALDFLRRDFDEMRATPGALQRQKEWAREDPDLESLRGDPRFEELIATDATDTTDE